MSSAYDQLLNATIQHLESLQASGVRHVAVTPETLRALTLPAPRAAASASAQSPISNRPLPKPESAVAPATGYRPSAVQPPVATAPLPAETPAQSEIQNPKSEIEKAAAFEELRTRALACVKCPNLAAARKYVVFGLGNINADLMFVGEAPGADEDEQGEPFVGKAGQLLTRIIETMGLQRSDVYIGNILKCRPDMPPGSSGNRKPTPAEMQTCIPYLHEQIDLIGPKVLVALGGTAMEGLLNKTGITKLRGNWHAYRGIPLMPTYHPSYLLRNQSLHEKRKVWEDMLQVMEKLGLPISEKQRNYFLKG
jgi:DNA polymerase